MKTKLPSYLAAKYSPDKRKRRREHRQASRELLGAGRNCGVGSTFWFVAQWHLGQARYLGR